MRHSDGIGDTDEPATAMRDEATGREAVEAADHQPAVTHASARNRKRLFRCVALLAGVLLIVGLLELPAALHWVDYRPIFGIRIISPWQRPEYQFDSELIYRRQPGRSIKTLRPRDQPDSASGAGERPTTIVMQYDQNGFRNPSAPIAAPIVAIGDSFVEGLGVEQPEVFTSRIAQQLGQPLLNLGHQGYGPQQELAVLKRYGLPARPKLVIWALCENNDLRDFEVYESFLRDPAQFDAKRSVRFETRSFVRNLGLAIRQWSGSAPEEQLLRHAWWGAIKVPGPYSGVRTSFTAWEMNLSLTRLPDMLKVYDQGAADCRRSGAKLMLVLVPTKYRVYGELCDFERNRRRDGWRLTDLPQRLETWSRANDAAFLDLTPALLQASRNGRLTYFLNDGHWTPDGHAVAAKAVVARLHRLSWLDTTASNPP